MPWLQDPSDLPGPPPAESRPTFGERGFGGFGGFLSSIMGGGDMKTPSLHHT